MVVDSRLRHVIESQQFSRSLLEELFARADEMKSEPHRFSGRLNGQVMAALFYEPSTRTRLSFEAAMLRLGGRTIGTDNAREFSSASKGETLEDSMRIVSGHADGIRIALVGDLANGRTVRSLTYLLSKFRDIRVAFVAPPQVAMRQDIKDHLDEHRIPWAETRDLNAVLPQVDVVYQTRIQKERFADEASYLEVKGVYRIDREAMSRLRKDAIVMHPLPRVDEISPEVDADPRAAYFRQARNGLFIRMALLDKVLA